MVESVLVTAGYSVTTAGDGQQAAALLEETPPVDLLFTDIRMPGGINGIGVADHYRKKAPQGRVIFATGYAHDIQGSVWNKPAATALLRKPYRPGQLLELIESMLA
jgi:CheY-like chemotaxis protein